MLFDCIYAWIELPSLSLSAANLLVRQPDLKVADQAIIVIRVEVWL